MATSHDAILEDAHDARPSRRDPPSAAGRRILLFGYLFLLSLLVCWRVGLADQGAALWVSEHPNWFLRSTILIASLAARDLLLFFALGFLVAGVFSGRRGWAQLVYVVIAGSLISFAIAFATRWALGELRRPTFAATTFLVFCCVWGCVSGATFVRARRVTRWFVALLAGSALIIGGASICLILGSLEPSALDITPEPLGSEDRRRLVRLFSEKDPRDLPPGSTSQITLTERDVNQLLAWGMPLGTHNGKARVRITPGVATLAVSVGVPRMQWYFNFTTAGEIIAGPGEVGFRPTRLRIGRLVVPRWWLRLGGPLVFDSSWQIEQARPLLDSLKGIDLAHQHVTVTYGHLQLPEGMVRDTLIGLGGSQNLATATSSYVELLVARAHAAATPPSFEDCLRTVFREAERRSVREDPVLENRAAILALGYLLGHDAVRRLVGPELTAPTDHAAIQFQRVTLRGRADWRRHFVLSAAIEALSNALTSNSLGLLKEELDADGGSGFSFSDLLADRAGTTMGKLATASAASARELQQRLAGVRRIDELFPAAADLPEGLTDAQLRDQYGGVGGAQYTRVVAEIDRRIAQCAVYAGQ